MQFDEIFETYYTLYRAESDVPASTDDEYTIGMRLANEGLYRWANYDGTIWEALYDTNRNDGSGTQTITTGTTSYNAPTNMDKPGGAVRVLDSNLNTVQTYPLIDPSEVQFKADDATYCYFTRSNIYYETGTASQSATTITGSGTTFTATMVGMEFAFDSGEKATITAYVSPTELTVDTSQTVGSGNYKIVKFGYKLNINPAPTSNLNGYYIDYTYIKKPTTYTSATSISEIPNPMFIVHRMLANRLRSSRNPYYNTAFADAEECLKIMQLENNAGSKANPWTLPDRSNSTWGN